MKTFKSLRCQSITMATSQRVCEQCGTEENLVSQILPAKHGIFLMFSLTPRSVYYLTIKKNTGMLTAKKATA